MKIAISEHLSCAQYEPTNEEIVLLRKLGKRSLSGVITTNYDILLESIFPNYAVYVGQEELLFNNISGIGEIYKIHGSITNPNSLVLTSLDYAEFEENASYLIAKLLTIFLEYPVILRHLRRDIYEMANSVQTSDKIVAVGFENLDDVSKVKQFILGVGVAKNGHIIKAEQLYEDIIFDNQYFDSDLVVEEYLPELLKNNSGGLPMYKYLSNYSKDVFGRVKENVLKHGTVDSFLNKQLRIQKEKYRGNANDLSVKGVIESETEDAAYKKLIFLEESEIEIDELKEYLQKYIKNYTPNCLKNNPELKRLIRIYDLVKYK